MPQNSPNLEYKSHLLQNVIIYCRPEFPPLSGAMIMENAGAIPVELQVADLENLCNTNNATVGLAPEEYTLLTLISLRGFPKKQPIRRSVHK